MLVVISKYTATLDGAGAVKFAVASDNLATPSAQEPGCHRFDICTDPGVRGGFTHVQYYDHQAAFDAHKSSAHFKAFAHTVSDVVIARSEEILALAFSPTGP